MVGFSYVGSFYPKVCYFWDVTELQYIIHDKLWTILKNFVHGMCSKCFRAFEPSFERCEEVDSVTLSAPVDGVLRDIGIFCGNRRPPMLMSPGSRLDVTHVSRSLTVSTRGFAAKYNFLTGPVLS